MSAAPPSAGSARGLLAGVLRRSRDFFWFGSPRLAGSRARDLAAVYAFFRLADDAADETADAPARLDMLEAELDRCYGEAPSADFAPLARAVRAHGLPRRDFAALFEALRADRRGVDHRTYAELLDYCRLSANPAGRIALRIFEAFEPANVELSDRVCTGLALANFCRDVGPDLERGRIYLPEEDRARFGVTREGLLSRRADAPFRALLAFEVGRARAFLRDGSPLIARVRRSLAWRVRACLDGGLRLLDRIEKANYDVFGARPGISRGWKARVAAMAWLATVLRRRAP